LTIEYVKEKRGRQFGLLLIGHLWLIDEETLAVTFSRESYTGLALIY
tara:strand:- start:513 stop:653 length:141 start_codon:yes stop_codon:yes gene_type:complete